MPLAVSSTMLGVFVVLPLGLPLLGVSQIDSLALAILCVGALADSFITKASFSMRGSEVNPLYALTRGILGQDGFVIAIAVIKMGVGLALLALVPDTYVLLLVALYSLSGVLFNSLGMALAGLNRVDPPPERRE